MYSALKLSKIEVPRPLSHRPLRWSPGEQALRDAIRVDDDAIFETQREVDWMNGRTTSMCAKIDLWRFESQARSGVVDRSLPKLAISRTLRQWPELFSSQSGFMTVLRGNSSRDLFLFLARSSPASARRAHLVPIIAALKHIHDL
jgi:hypothetical protein